MNSTLKQCSAYLPTIIGTAATVLAMNSVYQAQGLSGDFIVLGFTGAARLLNIGGRVGTPTPAPEAVP